MSKAIKKYLADNCEWVIIGSLLQIKATQIAGVGRNGLGGEIFVLLGVLVTVGFVRDIYNNIGDFLLPRSLDKSNKRHKKQYKIRY